MNLMPVHISVMRTQSFSHEVTHSFIHLAPIVKLFDLQHTNR